jgi:hypothetical protein
VQQHEDDKQQRDAHVDGHDDTGNHEG